MSGKPCIRPEGASFLGRMARGVLGVAVLIALTPLAVFLSIAAALLSRGEPRDE